MLADVLGVRGGIEVLDAPAVLAEVPKLRCPEPYSRYAQFWPHRHGTDAILRRAAPRQPLARDARDVGWVSGWSNVAGRWVLEERALAAGRSGGALGGC